MKKLLPIGSVVSIKDFDKLYIVCSADQKDEFEYVLAPYPSGITQLFLVRKEKKENIKEVLFAGYMDRESLYNLIKEDEGEE